MTRVTLLTPPGPGAVAVVAVEGAGALERVSRLSAEAPPASGGLRLVRLTCGGEELDEAILCVLDAERVELHLHGSPPLVEQVLHLLADPDPVGDAAQEPAKPNLEARDLEARARALLARAPCEAAARVLLDQAEGALRRDLEELRAAPGEGFDRRLSQLIERGRVARALLEPARVVLAGPVNAGKSTLFNLLVGEARVTVDAEAGTTRDVIRERALLGPWPVDLFDTAGERDVAGPGGAEARGPAREVEREGQLRARALARSADLVLWLRPLEGASAPKDPSDTGSSDPGPPAPGPAAARRPRHASLRTFADRAPHAGAPAAISATHDPEGARARVEATFRAALDLPAGFPWSAGAGVPFEGGLRAGLEALRRVSDRDQRGAAIDVLLRSATLDGNGGSIGRSGAPR